MNNQMINRKENLGVKREGGGIVWEGEKNWNKQWQKENRRCKVLNKKVIQLEKCYVYTV